MKKIAMVLGKPFPPDIRVEKEARVLLAHKFEIYLLTFGKKIVDSFDGIKIFSCERTSSFIQRSAENILYFRKHWHPRFARFIRSVLREIEPDVVHVHDIPFFKTALSARENRNIKFVIDLHENYPAALKEYRKGKKGLEWLKYALGGRYGRWVKYERWCLERADGILVVADEAKNRIVERYGIDPQKVALVSNTVEKDIFDLPVDPKISAEIRNRGRFLLLYLGGFGPHRGIDISIKAVASLKDKYPELKLLLVGAEGSYTNEVKRLIRELKVESMVDLIGWQPYKYIRSIIESVDICLVPHNRSEHTDTTIPHKLFQYMAFGKPVIVSDAPPLKRVVESERCGLVFKGGDYVDLACKVIEMLDRLGEFGERGKKAVLEKYIFEETDGKRLVEFYGRILG